MLCRNIAENTWLSAYQVRKKKKEGKILGLGVLGHKTLACFFICFYCGNTDVIATNL